MLIKKRLEGGVLEREYSESLHEKETKEFRNFLQNKGYNPHQIIREEVEKKKVSAGK